MGILFVKLVKEAKSNLYFLFVKFGQNSSLCKRFKSLPFPEEQTKSALPLTLIAKVRGNSLVEIDI